MSPQEASTLQRIEDKLDILSERVTTLIVKEAALEVRMDKQETAMSALQAAHNKALGILGLVTFPGVMTVLWLGIQFYSKKI